MVFNFYLFNTNIARFDEFNKQLLLNSAMLNSSESNPFLKQSKKPKINRAKIFINKGNSVLLSQEHRDYGKSYIDRILEIKHDRQSNRQSIL